MSWFLIHSNATIPEVEVGQSQMATLKEVFDDNSLNKISNGGRMFTIIAGKSSVRCGSQTEISAGRFLIIEMNRFNICAAMC